MSKLRYGRRLWDATKRMTFRYVHDIDHGKCIGRLYDQARPEALQGDIAPHSKPGGSPDVRLMDKASVLSFSDYCARHLIPHYPHTRR